MRFGFLLLFAACAKSSPAVAPAEPTPVADGRATSMFDDGCTCEELAAPLVVPTDAYERARWVRVANELATLEVALASLFVDGECSPSIETDAACVLAVNATALRERAELDADSCDRFARWRRSSHEAGLAIGALARGCLALSERARSQLSELIITRTCTTTSRLDEQDRHREKRPHERS